MASPDSGVRMRPLRMQGEFEGDRAVEVTASEFEPLSYGDLLHIVQGSESFVRLRFQSTETVVDGKPQPGTADVDARIRFHHAPAPFELVPGGWLPMPFISPPHFIVDRNVVVDLCRVRDGVTREDRVGFKWWTDFFSAGDGLFNPLPYAFEGAMRRTPTYEEFAAGLLTGVNELDDRREVAPSENNPSE